MEENNLKYLLDALRRLEADVKNYNPIVCTITKRGQIDTRGYLDAIAYINEMLPELLDWIDYISARLKDGYVEAKIVRETFNGGER